MHGEHFYGPVGNGFISAIRFKFFNYGLRFSSSFADSIRVLSSGMRQDLPKGIAQKTIILPSPIWAGYTDTRFKKCFRGNNKPIRLVSVGGITKNKQHAELLCIADQLNVRTVLEIVGDGPEYSTLVDVAKGLKNVDLNLPGRLDFHGVRTVLERSDIYIHPSRTEALPRAVMEAMAVGLPVICLNVGWVIDLFPTEAEGQVVESLEELKHLLEKNARRRRSESALWRNKLELFAKCLPIEKNIANYVAWVST